MSQKELVIKHKQEFLKKMAICVAFPIIVWGIISMATGKNFFDFGTSIPTTVIVMFALLLGLYTYYVKFLLFMQIKLFHAEEASKSGVIISEEFEIMGLKEKMSLMGFIYGNENFGDEVVGKYKRQLKFLFTSCILTFFIFVVVGTIFR